MEMESGDDSLDPRIAVELEKLNSATDEINKLETELDRANTSFRQLLTRTSAELESLGKKIGTAIDKARPFYEALAKAQNAHRACLSAAVQFQRANDLHSAAKATVALTEAKFNAKCLDSAWQEVLNHATMKVMESEKMKKDSEYQHRLRADDFAKAELKVHELEKHLNREIEKSQPYFHLKDKLNIDLQTVKYEIENLQKCIIESKKIYSNALKRLECISEEIHEKRNEQQQQEQQRTPGVGAERNNSSMSSSCSGDDECSSLK